MPITVTLSVIGIGPGRFPVTQPINEEYASGWIACAETIKSVANDDTFKNGIGIIRSPV